MTERIWQGWQLYQGSLNPAPTRDLMRQIVRNGRGEHAFAGETYLKQLGGWRTPNPTLPRFVVVHEKSKCYRVVDLLGVLAPSEPMCKDDACEFAEDMNELDRLDERGEG